MENRPPNLAQREISAAMGATLPLGRSDLTYGRGNQDMNPLLYQSHHRYFVPSIPFNPFPAWPEFRAGDYIYSKYLASVATQHENHHQGDHPVPRTENALVPHPLPTVSWTCTCDLCIKSVQKFIAALSNSNGMYTAAIASAGPTYTDLMNQSITVQPVVAQETGQGASAGIDVNNNVFKPAPNTNMSLADGGYGQGMDSLNRNPGYITGNHQGFLYRAGYPTLDSEMMGRLSPFNVNANPFFPYPYFHAAGTNDDKARENAGVEDVEANGEEEIIVVDDSNP